MGVERELISQSKANVRLYIWNHLYMDVSLHTGAEKPPQTVARKLNDTSLTSVEWSEADPLHHSEVMWEEKCINDEHVENNITV